MIKVKFEGSPELKRALERLPQSVSANVLKSALMQAGRPMFNRITDLYLETWQPTPRTSEEEIANNIKIEAIDEGGLPSVAIGPAAEFAYDTLRGEYGSSDRAAKPIYRPGFDETKDETIKVTGEALWEQIKTVGAVLPSSGGEE